MTCTSIARLGLLLVPLLVIAATGVARAATMPVAVAANFVGAAKAIGAAFKADTGDDIAISAGATGGLYTQISQGAPFEVFLAADSATPQKAVDAGYGVKGTEFTYAVGRLVLFSADPSRVTGAESLKSAEFRKLAIANPKTAPYGAAAVEAMQKLGVYEALAPKLVTGESIAQAYQFVDSGNAELGFVALSQVITRKDGSQWLVPEADYAPITEDAVLLQPGKDDKVAIAFLDFLKGPDVATIIKSFGYSTGKP